jgi:uncharacterized protein involved in cysteine biosynthesis
MKDIVTTVPEAFRNIFKDPVNFILFLIPGILAVVIYIVAGTYALENGMALTKVVINKYILSQNANMFMYYFVSGLMAFLLFILVSWTFVLMIGILSAPFNSVISARIENKIRGQMPTANKSQGIKDVVAGFGRTIFNEFKKLTVIIMATILASVPIINVMVPALATSYYTVLWTKRQQQKLIA